eukprot:6403175-Amphidinium_carterae.1
MVVRLALQETQSFLYLDQNSPMHFGDCQRSPDELRLPSFMIRIIWDLWHSCAETLTSNAHTARKRSECAL